MLLKKVNSTFFNFFDRSIMAIWGLSLNGFFIGIPSIDECAIAEYAIFCVEYNGDDEV